MAENLVFRADPSEPLQFGRDGFRRIAQGTVVLFKRVDYFPGNGRGPFSGLAVPVAVMFRVKGGKITKWLDAPLIPVGPGAPPMPGARGRAAPPPGGAPPPAQARANVPGAPVHAWATSKPQFIWNQQEREAADVVKGWVEAWATKDPQKVAEYMADTCVFRADPTQPLQRAEGRSWRGRRSSSEPSQRRRSTRSSSLAPSGIRPS